MSICTHDVGSMQGSQNQDDVSASVIPVRLRGGVVAVESSFRGGMKLEVLRSLCQVANDTQLRLEVALVDAQRRPSARSLSSQTSGPRRSDSLVRSGIRKCFHVFWRLLWACSASLGPSSLFAHP